MLTNNNICNAKEPFEKPERILHDLINAGAFSSSAKDNNVVPKPSSPPTIWPPPVHKSQSLPPFHPHQQDFRNPLNSSSVNQGPVQSFSMPWRSSDVTDRTSFNSRMPIQMPHQSSNSIHFNRQNHDQNSALQFQHHDPHGRMIHSASPQVPSHFVGQSPHHSASMENQHMHRVPGNSFHTHGVSGSLPPLPPGPPPPSGSHIVPHNLGSLLSNSSEKVFRVDQISCVTRIDLSAFYSLIQGTLLSAFNICHFTALCI